MPRIKEFNLPDLGEGLTEGEILTWLVKVGDTVELNQPIVEVETAKAAVEIPAKWAGTVTKIHHEAGTTVEVGAPIIAIDTDPTAGPLPADPPADAPAAASAPADEVEAGKIGGAAPGGRTAVLVGYGPKTAAAVRRPRKDRRVAGSPAPPGDACRCPAAPRHAGPATPARLPAPPVHDRPVLAKPPVRKFARDLGVDLPRLTGSGPVGSITREDVHAGGRSDRCRRAASAAATSRCSTRRGSSGSRSRASAS